MQLIGEHQAEDRQLITEVVLAKMNQMATRAPTRTSQRPPTTILQPQEGLTEPNKTLTPRAPPQGCLQYILNCNGVAVQTK
uniref:Synapsin ATP-binding domain-containing protein n=1 Tax=Electrophorus electricus TaxID=8005 RepID=A0A4W4FZB6_ELEEL